MVTTWKSGVYHLLHTCHIHIKVTIKLLDSERLLLDFRLLPRCKRDFSLFWEVTQSCLVVTRRFGTTYRFHLQGSIESCLILEDETDVLRNVRN